MTKITYIPGEIANAAIDEHGNRKPVTRTQHIFDDSKGKSQAEVNADIDGTLAFHQSEINALDSQNYVTVDTFEELPATGALDTIYRVANYDGTQVVTNKYAEYAWNGTQYKLLDVKDYGIDDEPTAGSDNPVKSGAVYNRTVFIMPYNDFTFEIRKTINSDETIGDNVKHACISSYIPVSSFGELVTSIDRILIIAYDDDYQRIGYGNWLETNRISVYDVLDLNKNAVYFRCKFSNSDNNSIPLNSTCNIRNIENIEDYTKNKLSSIDLEFDKYQKLIYPNINNVENAFISSNNLWNTAINYYGCFVPVSSNDLVIVRSRPTTESYIAFLKTKTISNGNPPSFSEISGFTTRLKVNANRSATYNVPSDCNFLYVYIENTDSGIYAPLDVTVNGTSVMIAISSIFDRLKTVENEDINLNTRCDLIESKDGIVMTTPFDSYEISHANIDSTGTYGVASRYESKFINVEGGFNVSILANTTQPSYIAFLKDNIVVSGESANFSDAEGFTSKITISSGTLEKYVVPSDVNYIFITVRNTNTGNVYEPASIAINGYDIINRKVFGIDFLDETVKKLQQPYFNPFILTPFYYHYNPGLLVKDSQGNNVIGSESIDDVKLAARLGFKLIEANIKRTSDNKFIVLHGVSGKFGSSFIGLNGDDVASMDINSVTYQYVKDNIRYNSSVAKYKKSIPSLEEFCIACKENNLGIFVGFGGRSDALETIVKYVGNNFIAYGVDSSIRNTFKGIVSHWFGSAEDQSADGMITYMKENYGTPACIAINYVAVERMIANDELDELIQKAHNNGFTVAAGYVSGNTAREFIRMGGDVVYSDGVVNDFSSNYELFDIDNGISAFTTDGTFSNGVVTLSAGEKLECGSNDVISVGKCYLNMDFNGKLNIKFGTSVDEENIVSDGSNSYFNSSYVLNGNTHLIIEAVENTSISSFVYKTSKC